MGSGTASIQSVVFHPDGGFDITYVEEADISPFGTTLHQHTCPGGVVSDAAVGEVIENIRELLDLALIAKFNDPTERIIHHK
jgi:hypothetical protein